MAKYAYKGVDSTGKAKRGTIEANNEDQARAKLKSEGFTIEDFGESKDIEIKIPKKVKNRDFYFSSTSILLSTLFTKCV